MPTYELVLLLKKLPTPELKESLKRTARCIFSLGGILRSINNLGFHPTPFRIKGNCGSVREANYFVYSFDSSEMKLPQLKKELMRDMALVRQSIYYIEDKLRIKINEKVPECDIYLDQLEVPLRPHVQQMVKISKKKEKKPFDFGGGRKFDPFCK